MSDLDSEIRAFEAIRPDLEAHHMGEWVLVHDGKLIGAYPTFDDAAEDAVERFGGGPFLIRQVGTSEVTLPASVMYKLT